MTTHDLRAIEALLVAPIRALIATYRRALTARLDFVDLVLPDEPRARRALHAHRVVAVHDLDHALRRVDELIANIEHLDARLDAVPVARRARVKHARFVARPASHDDIPF